MKEIIKKWDEFMDKWRSEHPLQQFGERKGYLKPDFYDFMEFLSNE